MSEKWAHYLNKILSFFGLTKKKNNNINSKFVTYERENKKGQIKKNTKKKTIKCIPPFIVVPSPKNELS